MKKKVIASLLCVAMAASMVVGCNSSSNSSDSEESSESTTEETAEEAPEEETIEFSDKDVESATVDQVQAFMNDDDEKTVLVDARTQEAYSGWTMEGAKNGGHLKNAVLYSARWFDCDYSSEVPRSAYLIREMEDQNITADSEVIVYDYTGEQATTVAQYFVAQGIENVTVFQANELIDEGTDVEAYENYDRFVPSELVKSVSDVKTGAAEELSDEAKAVFGDDIDNIVLVDVGWGNAKTSSYFSVGHVPGAVHINTDSYERPRVYVPEKRSEYAKEWRLISLEEFRDEVCTQYGIDKDTVVILTSNGTAPIGRLGFMLRSVGVKTYAMTGCLTAWKYNGYDLDTDESTLVVPTSVDDFGTDEIANPDEIVWTEEIEAIVAGESDGQVVDNRDEESRNGEYSGYSYHDLAGHVPNDYWCCEGDENGEYFMNADNTARTREEIIDYLENSGLDINKTMAFYCGDSWGAAAIAYWCQSLDLENVKEWGHGWIPWSNTGHEFIDHNGDLVHYDKYLDTVLDEDGKDMRDGVNILDDVVPEE